MVEVVIARKGKSMGNFELGRAPSLECILNSWKRKKPRTICHFFSCVHVFFWIRVLGATRCLTHPSFSLLAWKLFGSWALLFCILHVLQVFTLGETMIVVLQHYIELHSV